MAVGKTLTVYLAADVDKLRKGLRDADSSLSGFSKNLSNMVGPALIGAAAAAGTFAVAMAVDGVQAAIQEEAELAKLSTTLDNLGFGAQTDEVNGFIDSLQYSAAVSDSTLRPAFSRLLTATNDVTQAQKLFELALDVSAGTGKSLDTVTQALSKSMTGNLGALGKLGAGIDSQTIKSKDLDGALAQLSKTFDGQAATSASTLQGKMKILGISFDELKESFGTGFLDGLTNAGDGLDTVSEMMRDAQESAKTLGKILGDAGANLIDFGNDTLKTAEYLGRLQAQNEATKPPSWLSELASGIQKGLGGLPAFADVMDKMAAKADAATEAVGRNLSSLILWTNAAMQIDNYVRGGYSGIPASKMFFSLDDWREKQIALIKPLKETASASSGVAKAAKQMDPALRKQIDLVKELTDKVKDAGKALEDARKEMNDWISGMAGNILSGIDLGTIQEFDETGKRTGQSLLEGFNKQIDQAGLFGQYLKRLNSEGGPELRDAVAALGPEAGNKLAEEIIKEGLIPTMQSKLVDVRSMAETTAAEMVPPMLVAGVASAAGYLIKMQNELDASSSMLEEMGRKMGKTLSEAMVEEIRAALAAAGVAQTGAANVMAGVPADALSVQAQVAQRIDNPFMNSTAIMQAIQTAIQDSDRRLGRTGQVLNS